MGRIVTTALRCLVPPQRTDDCVESHILQWEYGDPLLSSHQNVPLWERLYQHVFCKKLSLFLSSSRFRNWGPSESACRHCAYPSPVPLLLATPLVIHEKNWKCLDPQAQGFPVALKEYFRRPNSLWTPAANPAIHVKYRFVLLRLLHFIFLFSVSVGLCIGFLRRSTLVLLPSFGNWIFGVSANVNYRILWWRWWSKCGRCWGTGR